MNNLVNNDLVIRDCFFFFFCFVIFFSSRKQEAMNDDETERCSTAVEYLNTHLEYIPSSFYEKYKNLCVKYNDYDAFCIGMNGQYNTPDTCMTIVLEVRSNNLIQFRLGVSRYGMWYLNFTELFPLANAKLYDWNMLEKRRMLFLLVKSLIIHELRYDTIHGMDKLKQEIEFDKLDV